MNEADLPPPRYRQEQLEVANGRLRLVVIAVLIVMLAGFALLGIQFRQLNARTRVAAEGYRELVLA